MPFGTNIYIDSTSSSGTTNSWGNLVTFSDGIVQEVSVNKQKGIAPQLYFKFVKNKMRTLEKLKFDRRIKKIEKAFYAAVENGQEVLAEKMLLAITREAKESAIYAKGVKLFIEKEDLDKHKKNIRGGHISDTKFSKYTRVIPKNVLEKKKKLEGAFDGFVVYHYWSPEADDVKSMSDEEKSAMKDPILFGVIAESNRMYFIADWEDEYCDLTFDEIIDVVGDDNVRELTSVPELVTL